jgi:hypothetical protein
VISTPQERVLRKYGYTLASILFLERRVNRWRRANGFDLRRAPSHIKAKAAVLDAVYGIGKK